LTEHLASALVSVLCLTASFYLLYAPTKKTPTIISTVPSEEIKEDFYWRKETAINANWTHEQLVQNAIAKNLDWEKNGVHFHKPPGCNPQHYPPAHCTMPVRNGSVKAIVAGNSFTYRAMGPIYETLKDKYSQLQMVMVSRCELFTTDFATYHSDKSECGSLAQQTHNATEAMEPDVLFLITRYLGNFTEEIKNITTDRWVQNALLHLEELSNSTKAIVISSPIHRFSFRVPKVIARQLQHKKNITEVDYTYEVFEKEHRNTMERLRFIVARCPKCFYFDMQRPFCAEDGWCATYDKETLLPFISDEEHISYRGNEVLF
uniref:SGNH domain-containing protein n=1 Tax=Steinernema glaseri TaxID=37863 RepID=A0A1I7XZR3_9BILA